MSQLVQNKQWKNIAVQRSEVITDTWDVIKVYLGRGAVVILFICMIGDVIQVLPGGLLQQWIISTILGVQIVTIDVAGFGLQSIAENARLNGDEKGYRKAMHTSYALYLYHDDNPFLAHYRANMAYHKALYGRSKRCIDTGTCRYDSSLRTHRTLTRQVTKS